MSSDSHSSPETPFKPPLAVKSRTPLPAGRSDVARKTKATQPEMEALKTAGKAVQVPSSVPPPESAEPESAEPESVAPKSLPVIEPAEVNGQAPLEKIVQPDENEETEENEEGSGDSELEPFDWDEFEYRYTLALKKMDQDEDDVVKEFDKFVDSFVLWARSGESRDNTRISKRLRTRTRFTKLSEHSLEDKKRHYIEVVEAFQKAMELLRQPR